VKSRFGVPVEDFSPARSPYLFLFLKKLYHVTHNLAVMSLYP